MSKLAHSDEQSMIEIDVRKAIENGDLDLIGLRPLERPRCEVQVNHWSGGRWDVTAQLWDRRCSYSALFLNTEGQGLCALHARRWAVRHALSSGEPTSRGEAEGPQTGNSGMTKKASKSNV
jgi:hypothetical protein